jgi:hypothetical protein
MCKSVSGLYGYAMQIIRKFVLYYSIITLKTTTKLKTVMVFEILKRQHIYVIAADANGFV